MFRVTPGAARAVKAVRLVGLQEYACAGNRCTGFQQALADAFECAPAACGGRCLTYEIRLAHGQFPGICVLRSFGGVLPFVKCIFRSADPYRLSMLNCASRQNRHLPVQHLKWERRKGGGRCRKTGRKDRPIMLMAAGGSPAGAWEEECRMDFSPRSRSLCICSYPVVDNMLFNAILPSHPSTAAFEYEGTPYDRP